MVQKPRDTEYADFYRGYVEMVGEGSILEILSSQLESAVSFFRRIPDELTSYRYETGKWSVAQVVGHLIDTERVMAFRALSFSRGDRNEIAGMDQDQYSLSAGHDEIKFAGLIDEFTTVRRSTILFFEHLTNESWDRAGIASGHPVSVRALAYIIAGHESHHLRVLRERYFKGDAFVHERTAGIK